MTFEELFRDFWWLIFPVFGMFMMLWSMFSSERRTRSTLDLIKSYIDQGKDPPPELLKLATDQEATTSNMGFASQQQNPGASRLWTFFTFAALTAGFGTGYWWVQGQDYAFAFLIVAVTMGVLALGALVILIFGRK